LGYRGFRRVGILGIGYFRPLLKGSVLGPFIRGSVLGPFIRGSVLGPFIPPPCIDIYIYVR
jgi:hypothetical protein